MLTFFSIFEFTFFSNQLSFSTFLFAFVCIFLFPFLFFILFILIHFLFLLFSALPVWWGEPYTINQTIWLAAAIVVPCYQFINLCTLCSKDTRWALPFQFVEGLKTARQIRLEDERQMNSLHFKMKVNFYRAIVLQYTIIISYSEWALLKF